MDLKFCPQCGGPLVERELGGAGRLTCRDPSCGYTFWGNPVPVVAGLVEHRGKVLLIQDRQWPRGWWGLVTGFLEAGETPAQGILREVDEELGLQGEIGGLIGVYGYRRQNQVIIAFHVRASGDIQVGEELRDYKAVAVDRLRPWSRATGKAVADWLALRKGEKVWGNWE